MTKSRSCVGFHALIAITAVIWAASGAASDYRVVETITLGETPPPFHVESYSPTLAATDDGYCAAWTDRRQGGAVLAARISHDGKLRDPFGLPIVAGNASAHYTIAVPGGCVVAWSRQSAIQGSFIASDSDRAVKIFEFPYPRAVLWKNRNRILLWAGGIDSKRLEMRTGFGEIIASSSYDPDLILVGAAEIGGELFIVARKVESSSLEIFRLDDHLNLHSTGQAMVDKDIMPTYEFPTRVGSTGDALIIATQTDYGPDFTVRWMTIRTDGSLISEGELEVPGVVGYSKRFVGAPSDRKLAANVHGGTLLIYGFGQPSGPTARMIESIHLTSTMDETKEPLFVSIAIRADGARGLIYEFGEPDGQGASLTEAPASQWLRDAAAGDETVALVWREDSKESFDLQLGLFSAEAMELVDVLRVASFPRSTHGVYPDADIAVEVIGNRVLVAYWGTDAQIDRDLFYRIASLEGEWLSPQVHLGAVEVDFSRDLVWSGDDSFYITIPTYGSPVRVAKISADGTLVLEASVPIEERFLAAAGTGEGFVYADGSAEVCHFSACPPPYYMAHLELLDESLSGPVRLTEEKLGALADPWLSTGDDSLLYGGWGEAHLFTRVARGSWVHTSTSTIRPGAHRASWVDDRYFLTGYTRDYYPPFQRYIYLGDLHPAAQVADISLKPIVDDWAGDNIAPAHAEIQSAGGRLILFSDVVSTNLEEGFVRRLRAHVLERFEPKRRAVSRR